MEASAFELTGLGVTPSTVFVISGASFVMRARMTDEWGGVVPEHPGLSWTVGTDLSEIGRGADSIILKAANVVPNTIRTSVTATVGGANTAATIIILAAGAAGTPDSSLGDNRAAIVPDVLLMHNLAASPAIDDSLVAFVGIGLLGDIAGSGDVARFANDQALDRRPVGFRVSTDIVDLRSPTSAPPHRPSYTLWIATSAHDALSFALEDVKLAAQIIRNQRTGLALQFTPKAAGSGPYTLASGSNPCVGALPKLQELGIPATATSFKPESLNVVYVDDLLIPPSSDDEIPISSLLTGYTCPADATIGAVILIAQRWKGTSTLTHELGHALGLHEPAGGHTLIIPGFSYTNMMWPREGDGSGLPRGYFTLGQAFRINLDDHSWLQVMAPTAIDCDVTGVDRSCPLLQTDVP